MNIYKVDRLKPNSVFDASIYGTIDGIKYLQSGSPLTQDHLEILKRRDEAEVYALNIEEEVAVDLAKEGTPLITPRSLSIDNVKPGRQLPRGVYTLLGTQLMVPTARKIRDEDLDKLSTLEQYQGKTIVVWCEDEFFPRDDRVSLRVAAYLCTLHGVATKPRQVVPKDIRRISSR